MSCWALIPLKARVAAKRRLATALGPQQRVQLVDAMLGHVIDTLRLTPGIDGVAVTSPEPAGGDVTWLVDRTGELNGALGEAVGRLARRGVDEIVVLHADLPHLGSSDVDALVAAGRIQGLALAADHRGGGTNGLYMRLPQEMDFCFGPDSLARFIARARRLGKQPALLHRPGLACDIDQPEDLRRLTKAFAAALKLPRGLVGEAEEYARVVHA